MNDQDNNIIDFKGGCLTTIGLVFVIWLVIKLLPFFLLLKAL